MEHEHTQSLYVHCAHCTMLGIPIGKPFEVVDCGNCGMPTDRWLVPKCCVDAAVAGVSEYARSLEETIAHAQFT